MKNVFSAAFLLLAVLSLAICLVTPARATSSSESSAAEFINHGVSLKEKGLLSEAIAAFNLAIQTGTHLSIAYNNRGLAWHARGNIDQALRDYDQAIAIDAACASAYSNRGLAHWDAGKMDLAIVDYTKAISLHKLPEAYLNRGVAYLEKGEMALAEKDFSMARMLGLKTDNQLTFAAANNRSNRLIASVDHTVLD